MGEEIELETKPFLEEDDFNDLSQSGAGIFKSGHSIRWDDKRKKAFSVIKHIALFFTPSFLQTSKHPIAKLHETAYLDGLRGYACYTVFFCHYFVAYNQQTQHAYGEVGTNNFYVFQLPFVRLLYNGRAAVAVFFVMSGYVLSYKPLKLLHQHDHEQFEKVLSSSLFRRWWRLYLPVAAVYFFNIILLELGAYNWFAVYHALNPNIPPGLAEAYMPRGKTFWGTIENAQIRFTEDIRHSLFQWDNGLYYPEIDGHTWTLPIEFRSSCVLFLVLFGMSKVRPNLRLAFFIFSTGFCLYWNEWYIGLFLGGSAIADLDLRRRRRALARKDLNSSELNSGFHPSHGVPQRFPLWRNLLSHYDQFLWWALFVASLFVMSYPASNAHLVPFHAYLEQWHPWRITGEWFWLSVSALVLVFTAGHLTSLQHFLTWRVSQYIGKTSFALYLVHGTVIRTLGHVVVIQTWVNITGYWNSPWGFTAGIILPLVFVIMPVAIVTSDWFWRGIDIPSVTFGKWLENLCKDKAS